MSALICGSLAYDTIMVFQDQFKNHILPDKMHILNVAFLVPRMRKEFGGCAGNIAYNLRLLGEDPVPMAAVGEDPSAPWVERALEWMLGRQNEDGGFGEGCSMAPVTAYVVLGALANGRAPAQAIDRAAEYLLRAQRPDGLWSNEGWLHMLAPDRRYVHPMPALPLLALAEYARWGA